MRNSGWYIPFWRRPKKKGKVEKPSTEEITRSDEQLEAVRQRWIERYRRMIKALNVMGLSMGSNRADVQARYEHLRTHGRMSLRELEDAYRFLIRALPPQERRKRRGVASISQGFSTATAQASATTTDADTQDEATDADDEAESAMDGDGDPDDDEGIESEANPDDDLDTAAEGDSDNYPQGTEDAE